MLKIGEAPVLPDGVKVAVSTVYGEGRIGRIEHELSRFGVNYQRIPVGSVKRGHRDGVDWIGPGLAVVGRAHHLQVRECDGFVGLLFPELENVHERAVGQHEDLAELYEALRVGLDDRARCLPSETAIGRTRKDGRLTLP